MLVSFLDQDYFCQWVDYKRLLKDLNIENICILHGDFHRLFSQVWPNNDNFESVIFGKIKSELKKMILSNKREEWQNSFNQEVVGNAKNLR